MRKQTGWLFLVLILSILLCACAAQENEAADEIPTAAATEAAPTEPEPTEPMIKMPETDSATGTLLFYFDDHQIHAGAPMSELIAMGVSTDQDLTAEVQPMHTSEVLTIRVDLENTAKDDDPLIFVVAINPEEEPLPVSKCRIYSITVNTESGIRFGSGNEAEPFVTGTTTKDEIVAAYGEPGFSRSGDAQFVEIAYYQNFNSAYFTFKDGKVRQIVTCYSANIFGEAGESFDYDLGGAYFGSDSAILMSQYLDVVPYLDGTAAVEKLAALEESFVADGQTIEFGMRAAQMPEPFGSQFKDLLMPVSQGIYIRTGRGNEEEFYIYNLDGQTENLANNLVVKGIITENCNYTSWGTDNSAFHEFAYMGLTQDSRIEDILEIFGAPLELQFTSNGRVCDAWMYYEDANGNWMQLRVDPMLDQLVEIRVSKYYPGEAMYQ